VGDFAGTLFDACSGVGSLNACSRGWRRWHREQLEEVLAGVHRSVLEHLMKQLKDLRSARELIDFVSAQDWGAIDADTRFIALHEVNAAITKLRERLGLPPIDDALPGQRATAFQIIRSIMSNFPLHAGK
jgi:hypothetical protein